MKNNWIKLLGLILVSGSLLFTSCGKDDDSTDSSDMTDLTLNITGLQNLGADYAYEGWIMVDGAPVSTGTFTSASGADSFSDFNGSEPTPAYPGEDFIMNAPAGLTFPAELLGGTAVISIEPSPDNSTAPFVLKPLVGMISATAEVHTPYALDNNAAATNPTGSVTIK